MPYAKKTLADLKQYLADKYSAGVVPSDVTKLAYWVRRLNEGVNYCAERLDLVKSTSLTTVSGTIALPDDFVSVKDVVSPDETHLSQISKEFAANATGTVYWITGNHLDGFALNTTEDTTYTVFYSFRPPELSADSDVCIIPDPLAPVCYAYSKIRMSESDPLEDAQSALDECDERMDKIVGDQSLNDGGIRITIQQNA
jgi:hypothetical protein